MIREMCLRKYVFAFGICLVWLRASALVAQDVVEPLSVLDLVEECDILAAHGLDPGRMSEGVDDDMIVPGLAVPACEDAVARNPEDARLIFQLGRAKLASGDRTAAILQFEDAASKDYAAAYAYLGDVHQFGLGTETNESEALTAYQKAKELGFPAEPQINMMEFNPEMYSVPLVAHLYAGSYSPNNTGKTLQLHMARNYVFSFITSINDECGAVLDSSIMATIYGHRYPTQGYDADTDSNIRVAVMGSTAEYDAQRFLRRHGCEGAVAKKMIASINQTFEKKGK